MKAFLLVVLLTGAVTMSGYLFWYRPKFNHAIATVTAARKTDLNETVKLRLKQKALSLRLLDPSGQYDQQYAFLVDMRIASGKKRFFVYNLEKDSVESAGLVTHGSGSDRGDDELYFSNTAESNCTSLGKYRIGHSYMGKFGLAFKLYGLDKTNSKAFERFVVLHAHSCVPDDEVSPLPICKSWGCPTVSPAFLTELKKYIDKSEAPILLWIYY